MYFDSSYGTRWSNRRPGRTSTADGPQRSSKLAQRQSIRNQSISYGQQTHKSRLNSVAYPTTQTTLKQHDQSARGSIKIISEHQFTDDCGKQVQKSEMEKRFSLAQPDVPNQLDREYSFQNAVVQRAGEMPRILPIQIANSLRLRFEQRVLRHRRRSSSNSSNSLKLLYSQNASVKKYLLVAAFLVNEGEVEAWFTYSDIKVEGLTGGSDECYVRRIELTQRRLRLLHRYYADARQYVVLYVNNKNVEHYLPIGLAPSRSPSANSTSDTFLHSQMLQTGQKAVVGFITAIFSRSNKRRSFSKERKRSLRERSSLSLANIVLCTVSCDHVERSPEEHAKRDSSLPTDNCNTQNNASSIGRTNCKLFRFSNRSYSQSGGKKMIRTVVKNTLSSYCVHIEQDPPTSEDSAPGISPTSLPNDISITSVSTESDHSPELQSDNLFHYHPASTAMFEINSAPAIFKKRQRQNEIQKDVWLPKVPQHTDATFLRPL